MAITGNKIVKQTTTEAVTDPTLFGFSLGRIVAFLGPHIAWISGAVATWLIVHVHFLALFHVGQSVVAQVIANSIVFGVTTLVTWLGAQKWLTNLGKWYEAQFGVKATH